MTPRLEGLRPKRLDAPVIEVQGLRKTFRSPWQRQGREALRGVDLTIARGTVYGLIGPNGAGKTTLIKTVLGITQPTSGAVRLFGQGPNRVEIRRRLGYLPERLALPRELTPVGFLRSVARFRKVPRARDEVDRQLARVDLSKDADIRVGKFSKGMRQRLGLAGALLGDPELLVLDEPTDGIDPLRRVEVRRILLEEHRRGATILLNSHLLAETEKICSRVGILHEGRLLREAELSELESENNRWLLEVEATRPAPELELEPSKEPGRWRCEVEGLDRLNDRLDRVRAAGLSVVEVRRSIPDLESVLSATIESP